MALRPFSRQLQRRGTHQNISFEFFPPKTDEALDALWHEIKHLEPLDPSFVSVTYGAGGSTRDRTHCTIKRLTEETNLVPAAHLTCVNMSEEELHFVLDGYWNLGVKHIVAIRGDLPEGTQQEHFTYANATDLTKAITDYRDFEVTVSCYPEGYPGSPNIDHDLDVLQAKIDNGATRAISQFFFEADTFCRFIDRAHRRGIHIPIVPGIMPVTNYKSLLRMAALCDTDVPLWVTKLFADTGGPDYRRLIATAVATELCADLIDRGIHDLHFYTLNKADLVYAVCRTLGVTPNYSHR